MKMKDFGNALLVAMLRHQRRIGFNKFFEPKAAAEQEGLAYVPGQIRLYVTRFDGLGYIKPAFTLGGGQDGGLNCYLTAGGIEVAEDLEQTIPELTRSNRYLLLSQRANEIEQLRERVRELTVAVKDNRDNDFVDKEGVLGELLALDLLFSQPQISVPLVEKILSETVSYLARKFADNAIGITAGAVLAFAATALGITIPH